MYAQFARYYDLLTRDVDYPARAGYFDGLIARHARRPGRLLLDLACGTGTLSLLMARRGWEVIGVDGSAEMLSLAALKPLEEGVARPLFLCQEMQRLDLYGTVDVCLCALDSLNHLTSLEAVEEVFGRVALFLETGGLFLFDVNTPYKHEQILGNSTFVREEGPVFCVWQNFLAPDRRTVNMDLDFFVSEGDNKYRRWSESFSERAYTIEELRDAAERAGLRTLAVYEADTTQPPGEAAQRLVFVMENETAHRGE